MRQADLLQLQSDWLAQGLARVPHAAPRCAGDTSANWDHALRTNALENAGKTAYFGGGSRP